MNISTHTGLLGFLLVLSALSIPAASAVTSPEVSAPSIEGRLNRITETLRKRESQVMDEAQLVGEELLLTRGFADGSRGGGWTQFARGGAATGPGGGSFANAHPAYRGGAAWRDGGGFANGAYGGAGFANGAYGGAAFRNGAYGGAGFRNGSAGGAAFRNW